VSFKVRHLLDPDFRNSLQDTVFELRSHRAAEEGIHK